MNASKKITPLHKVSNTCQLCHAKKVCISSCLSPDSLDLFDKIIVHRAPMQKGQRLFMAGDRLNSIFVLHSGSVKTYIQSSDGDTQITAFNMPGDIIGTHGMVEKIHSDTVEALETSSVCELKFEKFEDIATAFPEIEEKLMQHIFREMSREQGFLIVLGKMSAERRMAHLLLDLSTRLEDHGLSSHQIILPMTRHDIGNYLSLAVETVSRLLTRFQQADFIEVHGRSVLIKNKQSLKNILENNDICKKPTLKNVAK